VSVCKHTVTAVADNVLTDFFKPFCSIVYTADSRNYPNFIPCFRSAVLP
jgi:hypothetical protein